jgi:hypothetical protein
MTTTTPRARASSSVCRSTSTVCNAATTAVDGRRPLPLRPVGPRPFVSGRSTAGRTTVGYVSTWPSNAWTLLGHRRLRSTILWSVDAGRCHRTAFSRIVCTPGPWSRTPSPRPPGSALPPAR